VIITNHAAPIFRFAVLRNEFYQQFEADAQTQAEATDTPPREPGLLNVSGGRPRGLFVLRCSPLHLPIS